LQIDKPGGRLSVINPNLIIASDDNVLGLIQYTITRKIIGDYGHIVCRIRRPSINTHHAICTAAVGAIAVDCVCIGSRYKVCLLGGLPLGE